MQTSVDLTKFKDLLTDQLYKAVEAYSPELELEVRLGRVTNNKFATNLGEEAYNQILEEFTHRYPNQLSSLEIREIKNNKYRIRVNSSGDNEEMISKKRKRSKDIMVENFFDLRVSTSVERVADLDEEELSKNRNKIRKRGVKMTKLRNTFEFPLFVIDFTQVKFLRGGHEDKFQIEMEFKLGLIDEQRISEAVNSVVEKLGQMGLEL